MTSVESSALTQTPEEMAAHLCKLGQYSTHSFSEDILRRIVQVRDKCIQAEKGEGGGGLQSWRRPAHGGNSYTHRPASSSTNTGRGRGGNAYLNQSPTSSSQHHPPSKSTGYVLPQKYVSMFKQEHTNVEERILNKVILNKLNDFCEKNYDEIKVFFQQILDGDDQSFCRDFMELVFQKASHEPTFCGLYARLISELSPKYPVIQTEMQLLYKKFNSGFEDVSEEKDANYEEFLERNKDKIHRLGYSQFLSDLCSLGAVDVSQLKAIFEVILQQLKSITAPGQTKKNCVEEYSKCLLQMSKPFETGKSYKITTQRIALAKHCVPMLEELLTNRATNYPGLSGLAMFGLKECSRILQAKQM
jgi:hypothetical protein